MRSAEEWYSGFLDRKHSDGPMPSIVETIERAQRDAYRAGLEAAAKELEEEISHLESIELTEYGHGSLGTLRIKARNIRALIEKEAQAP